MGRPWWVLGDCEEGGEFCWREMGEERAGGEERVGCELALGNGEEDSLSLKHMLRHG
jgi:hypothetical protein